MASPLISPVSPTGAQSAIPAKTHAEIGRMFGELHVHPAAPADAEPGIFVIHAHADSKIANGEFWHSDVSCDEEPPLGTMLQIHTMPDCGGDTMFADGYAAWDALSPPMKTMLEGLHAVHESEHIYRGRYSERGVDDAGRVYPQAVHPVARTHAQTCKTSLFINRAFTTRIAELTPQESAPQPGYELPRTDQLPCRLAPGCCRRALRS